MFMQKVKLFLDTFFLGFLERENASKSFFFLKMNSYSINRFRQKQNITSIYDFSHLQVLILGLHSRALFLLRDLNLQGAKPQNFWVAFMIVLHSNNCLPQHNPQVLEPISNSCLDPKYLQNEMIFAKPHLLVLFDLKVSVFDLSTVLS